MSRLRGIRTGDIVECDVKGRRFYALVQSDGAEERQITVRPITAGITYRQITARQVIGHWRKARTAAPGGTIDPGNPGGPQA